MTGLSKPAWASVDLTIGRAGEEPGTQSGGSHLTIDRA